MLTSCIRLESACPDLPAYNEAITKFAELLVPGGLLVLAGVLNESHYPVAEEMFHSLRISQQDVGNALEVADFSTPVWNVAKCDSELDYVATHNYVLHAFKNSKSS